MDYKTLYIEAFDKKINEIDLEIISQLKVSRKRNKNFLTLSNNISKELSEKEVDLKTSLTTHFPDLNESYLRRFQEYESDHLTSFFTFNFPEFSDIYSAAELCKYATELGAYEGCLRAVNNFSNSTDFFKAIYKLDKNYKYISLDFHPNESPIESDLFHDMQKEIYPSYGQEPDWQAEALNQILKENSGENVKLEETQKKENTNLKPGEILNEDEKLYILHLLYKLITQGSEMTGTEFLRILHLTVDQIDTSAEIIENPPNYKKVKQGFSNVIPKNKKIKVIGSVISKIHGYTVPMLKQILDDELKALTKK